MPTFFQTALLAAIQGFAELLPVSSSAHVILAEKWMGLDPTKPEMTLLLVLLHTGTMLAVLVYFWKDWTGHYFQSASTAWPFARAVALATVGTGVLGLGLKVLIERVLLRDSARPEVESLFGNFTLISIALASAGLLILFSAAREGKIVEARGLGWRESLWIGLVQGLCLPFRGFSRSGATISTGLLLGVPKMKAEEFSFALALVLTPPVLLKEVHRLLKAQGLEGFAHGQVTALAWSSLSGLVLSFLAGLLALRWLSRWLQQGRWGFFGFYCLALSALVWFLRS